MTRVLINLRRLGKGGAEVPAVGTVVWTPSKRRSSSVDVVLPTSVTVRLVDGMAQIDVAPTTADWAWQVLENVSHGLVRFVAVPDTATVNYGDLVELDPATLQPNATPEAAWWYALEHQAGPSDAVLNQAITTWLDNNPIDGLPATGPNGYVLGSVDGVWEPVPAGAGPQGPPGIQGPKGDTGATGQAGPANVLAIGSVTTGASGTAASASITGTSPNQTLNLVIPQGAAGTQGTTGAPGPPNTLTIGSVTSISASAAASATITGTAPNQTLNLSLPRGATGSAGAQGPAGNGSYLLVGGGTQAVRVWAPSTTAPTAADGAVDGDRWIKLGP